MQLSKYISKEEFEHSNTAIAKGLSNEMTSEHEINARLLCTNILDKIREKFGPMKITSGYRGFRLNKAIGGVSSSQHCFGMAADFVIPTKSLRVIMDWIVNDSGMDYDQVIFEDIQNDGSAKWIHISFDKNRARKQALTMKKVGKKSTYLPYKSSSN